MATTIALKKGASYNLHVDGVAYKFTIHPVACTNKKVIDICKKINLLVVSEDEPAAQAAAVPSAAKTTAPIRKPGNPNFGKKAPPKPAEETTDDEQG